MLIFLATHALASLFCIILCDTGLVLDLRYSPAENGSNPEGRIRVEACETTTRRGRWVGLSFQSSVQLVLFSVAGQLFPLQRGKLGPNPSPSLSLLLSRVPIPEASADRICLDAASPQIHGCSSISH